NRLLVTASDAAGASSNAVKVPAILQDAAPPTVSITVPKADAVTSSRTLTAKASDPGTISSGLASVQFLINTHAGSNSTPPRDPPSGGPFSVDLPASQTDGVLQVEAIAKDKAGNQATSAVVSFTLDTKAPVAPTNLAAADRPSDAGRAIDLTWTL